MTTDSTGSLEDRRHSQKGLLLESIQLKRLWPYFERQKKLIVISAFLVPVIALATSLPAVVLKYVIDEGVVAGSERALFLGSLSYLAMVVLNYVTQTTQSFLSGYAVQHMATRLRSRLVEHVMRLPLRFHDHNMSGALVTRATGDFENLSQSLNQGILTSVADLAKLAGIIGGMFYLGIEFGLISIVVIALGGYVVNWFSRHLRAAMMESRRHSSRMNAFAQEVLANLVTIRHLSAEKSAAKHFDGLNEENRVSQMREVTHDANLFSFLDGISAICIGASLYFVAGQIGGPEAITAGTLVAFVQYMFQLFEPLKMLGNKIAMLQGVFTAIDRIFGILDEKDTVEGTLPVEQISGAIDVRGLTFHYSHANESPAILNNVTFSLKQGESLAIVGRTGSGKSTIIKILTKLYGGYAGSVRIDGRELRDLRGDSLREHIAVVTQDVTLFNESVSFNVSLGNPKISQEMIEDACRLAGANRFIKKLPNGYDFILSEKGENLSQGQRQLVSLARALAHEPKILILDEATSSVDPESEQIFQQAVERIMGHCTALVIAHRLETIAKCNRVLLLHQGQVGEYGTYQELIAARGMFWELKNQREIAEHAQASPLEQASHPISFPESKASQSVP